jgi:hypothetical protein
MENGLTKDEINSINNAVNAMAKVKLFCDICRNVSCICKIGENTSIIKATLFYEYEEEEEEEEEYDNIGLCSYCNHYHNLDNECTE